MEMAAWPTIVAAGLVPAAGVPHDIKKRKERRKE